MERYQKDGENRGGKTQQSGREQGEAIRLSLQPARQDEGLIQKAYDLFDEFYGKTAALRQGWEENEEIYRTHHWGGNADGYGGDSREPLPVNPVLFSTVESMLADMMDSYPQAVILAEEENDDGVAETLSRVVQFILKRRNYRSVYRKKVRQALIKGTSVQEVYWDTSLYGGLGDVNIRPWDVKHFLFDPQCESFQEGRGVIKFGFVTREWLCDRYPFFSSFADTVKPDHIRPAGDNREDVMILEYWYKERDTSGNQRVHLAVCAGRVLLYNSKESRKEGMYAHGMYPFVVEPLFPLEGQLTGLSVVDVLKNLQHYADKLDQIILKNALTSGKMRMLVNRNAQVEEDALLDWDKELVRANRIDEGSLRWMQPAPLNPYVVAHYNQKIEAMKEESGQTMFSRGEAGRGVTAATSILALQEAGSKRSRLLIEQLFDGFSDLVRMVIEVIAENYDEERVFRIRGEGNGQALAGAIKLSGGMLTKAHSQGRGLLEFDIALEVQKQSPYQTAYQNELAIQLLSKGILSGSQALSMMTFPGKERIAAEREEEQGQDPGAPPQTL